MPVEFKNRLPETIRWKDGKLFLLDQTRLPHEELLEEHHNAEEVWHAIQKLKVRGAPAIGVAAAYGLCVAVREQTGLALKEFRERLRLQAGYLESSRPTAVNLAWALKRMLRMAEHSSLESSSGLYQELIAEAEMIHAEDQRLCLRLGEHGAALIKNGMGVLTHCNAGAMATSGIGTATAPMYIAHSRGVRFRVYADETRPLLQGARITSWELQRSGLNVTLNTDSAAAHLMSEGLINLVLVGTDRVAANGDVANKIGTLGVAIQAQHFGIPFYVACPSSTYDPFTSSGKDIVIEERARSEVVAFDATVVAPVGVQVRNPAFDVTPHELVSGLITEKGIVRAPFREGMHTLLGK